MLRGKGGSGNNRPGGVLFSSHYVINVIRIYIIMYCYPAHPPTLCPYYPEKSSPYCIQKVDI